MNKHKVSVSVIGRPNTGKTTIIKKIIAALTAADIEVEAMWGVDGPPREGNEEFDRKRSQVIAKKTKVVIAEFHSNRVTGRDSPDDVRVQVEHSASSGFGVVLIVAGTNLRKDFGPESYHQERARSVAARLAAELEVDVEDNTRNEHSWVQPWIGPPH